MERTSADKFTNEQITQSLKGLSGWTYNTNTGTVEKDYLRDNFLDAVAFIQQIAGIAQEQDHHPDLLLHGYKHVKVSVSTHSASGITQNDFDLAHAIEKLA